MRFVFGLVILMFGSNLVVAQEVRYVDDYLVITLRAGMGSDYKILKTLPTGARLEVLDSQGEFTEVRTESGLQGWVLTQYLSEQPVARVRLSQAQADVAALTATNRQLKDEMAQMRQTLNALQVEHKTTLENYARVDTDNARLRDLAARPQALARDNESLRQRSEQLAGQVDTLSSENERLQANEVQRWFLAGGGVLLLGVLMGLILPKFGRRKRSAWH